MTYTEEQIEEALAWADQHGTCLAVEIDILAAALRDARVERDAAVAELVRQTTRFAREKWDAYESGYSRGHNDTVESRVVTPEEAAGDYFCPRPLPPPPKEEV